MKYQLILFALFVTKVNSLNFCWGINWSPNASTVAGSSIGIGDTNASTLLFPFDVYISNNSLYVLDTGNFRVQFWSEDATNGITVINGSQGNTLNKFDTMVEIDMDDNTNQLYILDLRNHRVVKWNLFGTNGTIVAGGNRSGNTSDLLYEPQGMFIEKDSLNIWIADSGNHRIVKWTLTMESSIIGGSQGIENDQFDTPTGIFIHENDQNTIYIADSYNQRIQRWLQGDNSGTTVAGETGVIGNDLSHFYYPNKILVDDNHNMFILDNGNKRVLRWQIGQTSGELIAGDSTVGIQPTQINYPQSIRFGLNGSLYVTDTFNNRIQKFHPNCPITTTTTTTTTTVTSTSTTTLTTTTSNGIINVGSIFIFPILLSFY